MKEEKIREAAIAEEKRIETENKRIKEWEIKFDEDQKKKEDELIKKFEDREKFKKEEIKEISSNDDTH